VHVSDWFDAGGDGSSCDVVALLDSGASDLLSGCVALGALVSLGLTGDGGALGVTVTVDGRWRREYFRDAEALTDWLAGGMPSIEAACKARAASSGPRQRQRSPRGR
jgi:hypothetical protein